MRKLTEEESELTKTARRQQERQTQWERSRKTSQTKPRQQVKSPPEEIPEDDLVVRPFDGIRES
jgi:hypothetical protein